MKRIGLFSWLLRESERNETSARKTLFCWGSDTKETGPKCLTEKGTCPLFLAVLNNSHQPWMQSIPHWMKTSKNHPEHKCSGHFEPASHSEQQQCCVREASIHNTPRLFRFIYRRSNNNELPRTNNWVWIAGYAWWLNMRLHLRTERVNLTALSSYLIPSKAEMPVNMFCSWAHPVRIITELGQSNSQIRPTNPQRKPLPVNPPFRFLFSNGLKP